MNGHVKVGPFINSHLKLRSPQVIHTSPYLSKPLTVRFGERSTSCWTDSHRNHNLCHTFSITPRQGNHEGVIQGVRVDGTWIGMHAVLGLLHLACNPTLILQQLSFIQPYRRVKTRPRNCKCLVWRTLVFSLVLPLVLGLYA